MSAPAADRPLLEPIRTDPVAVASLVCGLLAPVDFAVAAAVGDRWLAHALTWLVVGLPLAAIVLGWVSMIRIRRSGGSLQGRGVAKAGIWVGIVDLVLLATLVALLIWWISHWNLTF